MTLYTYGYLGGSLEDLCRWAGVGAVILDTRLVPTSRNPLFRRGHLQRVIGSSYVSEQALGNINFKTGGPIVLKDWDTGWATLQQLLDSGPVILLCACRDAAVCHRSTVAAMAQEERPELRVVHLSPGDELSR